MTPIAVFIFPLLPFLYAHYKSVEWRWWLNGIRLGDVQVQSNLGPSALQGLYWKVIGWSMLLSTVFAALLGAAGYTAKEMGAEAGPDAMLQNIPLLIVTIVGYLALALGISVVTRLYLSRDLWVRVLASIKLTGLEATANVTARGDLASALGEGFADGLDVGGF